MLRGLLDLLIPERCAGCAQPTAPLCPPCAAELGGPARRTRPDPAPVGLPPVWTSCEYAGAVRRILVAHKERGRHDLSPLLGAALAGAVACAADPDEPVLVVPIPSRRSGVRSRGYDHAVRIASAAVDRLRAEGRDARLVTTLRLHVAVADQGGLSAAARGRNLAGAMVADRELRLHAQSESHWKRPYRANCGPAGSEVPRGHL